MVEWLSTFWVTLLQNASHTAAPMGAHDDEIALFPFRV
jgi:hypothetical protein